MVILLNTPSKPTITKIVCHRQKTCTSINNSSLIALIHVVNKYDGFSSYEPQHEEGVQYGCLVLFLSVDDVVCELCDRRQLRLLQLQSHRVVQDQLFEREHILAERGAG